MNRKDLSEQNVMSLHYELMRATQRYEMYLNERNDRMSELWYRLMELIVEDMKNLDNDGI